MVELFSDCLKKFENTSRRNALYNMFGTGVKVTTSGSSKPQNKIVTPVTRGKPKVAPTTQKTISSFLMDSFIVDNIRKKDRATAAAKKKIKEQASEGEMFMASPGDREWESQLAVDTYEKLNSLEGDVNGAARGSRVGESVGRGHI